VQSVLPKWRWRQAEKTSQETEPLGSEGGRHLELARRSLQDLLADSHVPEDVRLALSADYSQVRDMLEKVEHQQLHIAVFGQVSVGKSALLNALLGEQRFSTSALHGETREARRASWDEVEAGGVFLIDTPGINEVDGESRERLAIEVAERSDLVLFVVDGDITDIELQALERLASRHRPLLLVLNKIDQYRLKDRELLLDSLRQRAGRLVDLPNILPAAADPGERLYVDTDPQGRERETWRRPAPDVGALRQRLWEIIEREGKTLVALNASLFAGKLSDQVARRIAEVKRGLAERVVRMYCVTKGVAVAFNPMPVADLLAVPAVDTAMVTHLARIYGLALGRREARELVSTVGKQMLLVMGTVWAVNALSSVLKGGSAGLSTLITAGAQGAVGYYSTYIIGEAAHRYIAQGKSWGETGPKRVVQSILEGLDRGSVLNEAKRDILSYIGRG